MSSIFGDKPVVGIIMGSESDMPTMEAFPTRLRWQALTASPQRCTNGHLLQ